MIKNKNKEKCKKTFLFENAADFVSHLTFPFTNTLQILRKEKRSKVNF